MIDNHELSLKELGNITEKRTIEFIHRLGFILEGLRGTAPTGPQQAQDPCDGLKSSLMRAESNMVEIGFRLGELESLIGVNQGTSCASNAGPVGVGMRCK